MVTTGPYGDAPQERAYPPVGDPTAFGGHPPATSPPPPGGSPAASGAHPAGPGTYPAAPGTYPAPQPGYGAPAGGYPPNAYAANRYMNPYVPGSVGGYLPPRNGLGVAALVLGICSCALFFWPWLCWPAGILAISFGAVGISRANSGQAFNKGQAKAGLILGISGLLADVIFIIVVLGAIFSTVNTVVTL